MFGSAILEVAIGMILIYLVLSLVMTSVQEGLHALGKTRARNLEQALLELLQGDETLRDQFYLHPLIYALHRGQAPAGGAAIGGAATTPDRAPAGEDGIGGVSTVADTAPAASGGIRPVSQLPSYIPRETFSAALIDLKARLDAAGQKLPPRLQQAFDAMERMAGGRVDALRTEIERWFDAAMDRTSGRFKRKSQLSLFLISLGAAVLLNFNSISLAQYLAVSPQQRALVTRLAEETLEQRTRSAQPDAGEAGGESAEPGAAAEFDAAAAKEAAARLEASAAGGSAGDGGAGRNQAAPATGGPAPAPAADAPLLPRGEVRALTRELREIGLPIGWSATSVDWLRRGFPDGRMDLFQGEGILAAVFAWLLLVAGYLMTAFAVMLGAPFWFDLLNKFMVIRGTVKPREKSPDEASEDRQPRVRRDGANGEPAG